MGYKRFENVITSLEFERLICASGPTGGHLVRPSDGQTPKRVAFVLCAGSRDNTGTGKPYCSRFCCMYSLKHAHQIIEKIPGCIPYIFYMDIRSFGKMYEEFYYRIQDEGAKFIRGRVANILEDKKTKNLHVMTDDTLLDRPVDMEVDLVVLAAAVQPSADTNRTRKLFGVSCSMDGWLLEAHPETEPVRDHHSRCLPCRCLPGTQGYPRHGSICRRRSICRPVSRSTWEKSSSSPTSPPVLMRNAQVAVCASTFAPTVPLLSLKRTGAPSWRLPRPSARAAVPCGGFCPGGAIWMNHFTTPQIVAQIDAFLLGGEQ